MSAKELAVREENILEIVRALVFWTIALKPDLDASENHLLSTPEIDAQLNNVSVLHRVKPGLHVWLAEPDVVQESARRTCHVLDLPCTVNIAELAMFPAYHLRLEANRSI